MKNPPAFQFYAADFDMATNTWDLDEVGLYMRLLISQWVNGRLPSDHKKLAKIGRISPKKFSNLFRNVSEKFISDGNGNIFNVKLEKVRREQINYRESQSKHGKAGAKKRWGSQ